MFRAPLFGIMCNMAMEAKQTVATQQVGLTGCVTDATLPTCHTT
jgi:hypothetical protein